MLHLHIYFCVIANTPSIVIMINDILVAQTKRPPTKLSTDKMSHGTKRPTDKMSYGTKRPTDKMSHGTKRHKD